jgi:hypothetical protein
MKKCPHCKRDTDAPPRKPKPKGGANTKLTPEVHAAIIDAVTACATLREAILRLQLDESTVYKWLDRGRLEGRGRFFRFLKAYEGAKAERSMALKAQIRQHSGKDWRAAEAVLHLTEPATQKAVRVVVTSELTGAFQRLKQAFANDPPNLRRALTALAGEDGAGGASSDAPRSDGVDGGEVGEAVRAPPAEPDAG